MSTSQLPLALRWPRRQRFEHFYAGDSAVTVDSVRRAAALGGQPWPFVVGPHGSGKTHILAAACQLATECGWRVQYLPLATLGAGAVPALRGSVGSEFVALDDVEAIAGNREAEHALFDFYNRAHAEDVTLVFASACTPAQLSLTLPDLRSRLAACTLCPLKPLDEASRRRVLHDYARARGIELDAHVLDWLFTRYARDLGALHALLDELDSASLAAKRRITVPFLRDFLREREDQGKA
ncbi:MAG TPA: DnaA regulatory inactivator Hda [Rhodanobacteraceae bacterium]